MMHHHHHSWIYTHWMTLWMVVVALQPILVGLRILLTRRPLVLSDRWGMFPWVASLLPVAASLFDHPSWEALCVASLMAALPWFVWRRARGVMVLGATKERLREAWQDALDICRYTVEEGFEGEYRVLEPGARLRVGMPEMFRGGTIVALERDGTPTMKLLAHGIRQSFASHPRSIHLVGAIAHLLVGVGLLGLGLWFWSINSVGAS